MIRQKSFILFFLILFLVQGCGSYQQRTATPYRKKAEPQKSTTPPHQQRAIKHSATLPQSSVVKGISNQASKLTRNGDLDAAAQTLERGLRIAPKDAQLWSQLATVRLKQQRYGQAKSLAAKSSSFARNNTALVARNKAIIEQAGK